MSENGWTRWLKFTCDEVTWWRNFWNGRRRYNRGLMAFLKFFSQQGTEAKKIEKYFGSFAVLAVCGQKSGKSRF